MIAFPITLSDTSRFVLQKRYLQPGETPEGLFARVATTIAAAEKKDTDLWAQAFYDLMARRKFLPNSPTLANAGIPGRGCLSACFVCSPRDSMESILQVQKEWGLIEKWGGGVGMGLSKIRPRNDKITTTHGKSLGPIAIMRMYAASSDEITQGSFRRGAHMAQLHCTHPDIQAFIHCKDDDGLRLSSFNISVQLTDEFMHAVEEDKEWKLVSPRDGAVWKTVRAKQLWEEICLSAWKTGDPGVVFLDEVWRTQPNPQLGNIESSNPCGEENLEDHGNCCLGSLNLAEYVTSNGQLNYALLGEDIRTAVRFLDDVIEVNSFPLEVLRSVNLATRRIGLGVMGWADVLAYAGIPYDSPKALQWAEEVAAFLQKTAWACSAALAEERGAYPEYARSALKAGGSPPVRHSSVVTIAPTGTISRIAGCSSGIEPYYELAWWSHILWENQEGQSTKILDAPAPLRAQLGDLGLEEKKMQATLTEIADNPEKGKKTFAKYGIGLDAYKTAHEVSPEAHVRMQAAWQKYATNAVSKTVNLPREATVEDVSGAFMLAWKLKCRSVTVYRDGSKAMQVLETGKTKKPKDRPRRVAGVTERVRTGHGTLYTTINSQGGKPFEVFSALGKAGSCDAAFLEAISRLVSLSLRAGVSSEEVVKQLKGIVCHPVWDEGAKVESPVDAIALSMVRLDGEGVLEKGKLVESPCPECGGAMQRGEGCMTCLSCGRSEC